MVDLLLDEDSAALGGEAPVRTVYDPAAGTGGMLTIAGQRLRQFNPDATVEVSGQELNPGGGSRLAIVLSDSPLFSGGAGSGESEIRRWIIENDLLEGIVGLPDQMFYTPGSRPSSGS